MGLGTVVAGVLIAFLIIFVIGIAITAVVFSNLPDDLGTVEITTETTYTEIKCDYNEYTNTVTCS